MPTLMTMDLWLMVNWVISSLCLLSTHRQVHSECDLKTQHRRIKDCQRTLASPAGPSPCQPQVLRWRQSQRQTCQRTRYLPSLRPESVKRDQAARPCALHPEVDCPGRSTRCTCAYSRSHSPASGQPSVDRSVSCLMQPSTSSQASVDRMRRS